MVSLGIPLAFAFTTLRARQAASARRVGLATLLTWNNVQKYSTAGAKVSCSCTTTATTTTALMSSATPSSPVHEITTGYLSAADAYALDQDLMQTPGYTLDQLMELAGLSVAEAVVQVVPPVSRILLICGPGNNGGDGLVAARHLVLFGHEAVIVYPKRSNREPHYVNLVKQCEDMGIVIMDELPKDIFNNYDAMVDAIFGFSFQGTPREPFQSILETMMTIQNNHNIPIISVDVPSGWDVDEGDVSSTGFSPQVLVSLTAPKNSSKGFLGRHFCGGRFLPPKLAAKYNIQMPNYPGVAQVVELTTNYSWEHEYAQHCAEQERKPLDCSKELPESESWEAGYAAYCAEKERELNRRDKDYARNKPESATTSTDTSSWEAEYAAYCAQKEENLKDTS